MGALDEKNTVGEVPGSRAGSGCFAPVAHHPEPDEAEPEHQDYLERIPHGYTCHFARPDWVLPKRDAAE